MGSWGWPAGLGFRLRAFAAVLNPGLGNGRTLRSPAGEIGLSEIQIVFVKVSICPETMRLHPESSRETHFEATVTRFEHSSEFVQKPKGSRGGQGAGRGHLRSWAPERGRGRPRQSGSSLRLAVSRNPEANLFAQGRRFLLAAAVPPRSAVNRKPLIPARSMEISVHGASSRTLTGEIGLSDIRNVFAEVFICPETMKLHQKSLRETHFEATVTRFEYSSEFSRKSKVKRSGPGRVASVAAREARGPGQPG